MRSSRQKLSPEDKEMMREFEITDDESSASDLARMGRDQRGRVPDVPGQTEEDDADASETEDAAVAEHTSTRTAQPALARPQNDCWVWTGTDKICRYHRRPRLVSFVPTSSDCPVDLNKLSNERRTCAYNIATRRSLEKHDDWRKPGNRCCHPFSMQSNEDSSDGDYDLNKWCGFTEFTVLEDSAPATQWTEERLLIEYCCGENSRLGNPRNFVDSACTVLRLTEKDDMRTKRDCETHLVSSRTSRVNILRYGAPFLAPGGHHGST